MTTENVIAKLAYLEDTKLAIKEAIIDKGVSFNGDENFIGYAFKIGEIQTIVPETVDFLVKFIDYDGTILKEQRVNSGEDATAPTLPTHDNLTFQEWNNAFTNVTRDIDIGATYITTDGKTHIFIMLTTPTGLAPTLHLTKFTADVMTINWGDGNSETDSTNDNFSKNHIYATAGNYVITIECAGSYTLGEDYNNLAIFEEYPYILTKILIGENVTSIISQAFSSCYSLQKIVIPTGITSFANYVFEFCNSLKSIVIPAGLTTMPAYVLKDCYSVTNIVLPSSLTSIAGSAFLNCHSLQSIVIPAGVTSISVSVFESCYLLKSIKVPDGVTVIQASMNRFCFSLQSINLPDGVTSIQTSAFENCYSLESIVLPNSLISIANNVFDSCSSLKSIIIPAGVTSIGSSVFNYCSSLKSIEIQAGVSSIGLSTFANCDSLESIVIPDGCIVGTDFFENCYTLKTFTIPEGQISIGNDFSINNKSLKSVYLPSTITSIADDAFSFCQQLNTLEILAITPPTLHAGAFDIYSKILKIYVPDASIAAYQAATNWLTLANYIFPISTRP